MHIIEMGLAMLGQAALPSHFRDNLFVTAVFLINRIPCKHHDHHSDLPSTHIPFSDSPSAQGTSSTHPMIIRAKADVIKPKLLIATLPSSLLPKSTYIALLILVWKQAMLDEFLALLKNHTWTLTELPPDKNLIRSTWIFIIKRFSDGTIARHKARLVAQGFSQ
ncbi:hypothetical protein SASPL_128088 [Salvia splendens]|uniref:Mitochondrial protein n=1 Tax=Salvia splendens TaxID=180675 RepID=A0A8X8XEF8_SALSN|nr:hypothetical protein SASPL_128088 [Salvia splendens]